MKKRRAPKALKPFELIEHTADIGVRAFGKTPQQLFINAAKGMFFLIARRKRAAKKSVLQQTVNVDVVAGNAEELLVSWLSELLAVSDSNNLFFTHFHILRLTDTALKAQADAEPFNTTDHVLAAQVKAVTYHRLSIKREGGVLQAEVIFDI